MSKWECLFFYLSCLREFRGHVSLINLLCPVSWTLLPFSLATISLYYKTTLSPFTLFPSSTSFCGQDPFIPRSSSKHFIFFLSLPGDFSLQSFGFRGVWEFEFLKVKLRNLSLLGKYEIYETWIQA